MAPQTPDGERAATSRRRIVARPAAPPVAPRASRPSPRAGTHPDRRVPHVLDPARLDGYRTEVAVAIALASAFCLFWRLDVAAWRIDEHLDGTAAWMAIHGDWSAENGHPPFVRWFLGVGQLAFGETRLGVRITPALAGLALVGLLFVVGRRMAGFWAGAAAAAIWGVVPRPIASGRELFAIRLDRYAYLEPWASLFLVAAVGVGWRWIREGGWRLALATGALVGLGAAFKPTVFLVVPAIAGFALVVRRDLRAVVPQAAAMAGTSVAVALLTFAPLGSDAPSAVRNLIEFQQRHVETGHALVVGDARTLQQPWWTNLWEQWHGSGAPVTIALVGLALAALTGRHRAVAAYLHLVLLTVVVAHCASPVALPHYHALWLPLLALLAGIGLTDLLADGPRVARAGATVAVLVLAVAGTVGVVRVATLPEADLDRVAEQVAAAGLEPDVVVFAGEPVERTFPDSRIWFFGSEPPAETPDLMVLDLDYARLLRIDDVERFRSKAMAAGLTYHRLGGIEWWA